MSEEIVQPNAGASEAPAQTPTESYVNPDGTFKDGWQTKFVPAEYQKNTTWLGVRGVEDFVKQTVHLQTKLSSQGKGVFPLKDDSTPEHVREYRQAFGIPEKPDGYQFTPPQEVAKYYDKDTMSQFQQVAHKYNFTPQQYAAVMAFHAGTLSDSDKALTSNPMEFYNEIKPAVMEIQRKECEAELRNKWGDAFDSRIHLANLAIAENVKDEGEKAILLERIGNDPLIADFLATVQHKYATEASGVDISLGTGNSSLNVDQKIESINAQLTQELKLSNRAKFDALLAEKNELYSKRYQ